MREACVVPAPRLRPGHRARLLVLLPACLIFAGCVAKVGVHRPPEADLSSLRTFYVQRLDADRRGIEQVIARELVQLGFEASAGDAPDPPEAVDAIVTYQDRWMWDLTMYMVQLDIQVRDPATKMALATGSSTRTSLARRSPATMAREVLQSVLGAK